MSEASQYKDVESRFHALGLAAAPADAPPSPRTFAFGRNIRSMLHGTVQSRPNTAAVLTTANSKSSAHSIATLYDALVADYTYIVGAGDELQRGKTGALATIGTAFSGQPLTLLPFTPEQARRPWMAVADSAKMLKAPKTGVTHQLGLPQPTVPPFVELDWINPPLRIDVDDGSHAASWSGGATQQTRATPAFVSQSYAGEDPTLGLVGAWYAVELSAIANLGPGTVLLDTITASTVYIEEVHPATVAAATIQRLIFDVGTSGWATIIPSTSLTEFAQHALLKITGGATQKTAITHVLKGPDGTLALRCYINFIGVAEGDTLATLPSVYGYTSGALVGPFTCKATKWTAIGVSSTATFLRTGLTLNLASYSSGGRAVDQVEDEVHCSTWLNFPANLATMKIEADVDDGTFTRNYVTRSIDGAELALLAAAQATPVDTAAAIKHRQLISPPQIGRQPGSGDDDFGHRGVHGGFDDSEGGTGPVVDTPGTGVSISSTTQSQWREVRFKMSGWQRFGDDVSKTLANVVALRISMTTNDNGGLDVQFGSWWVGGGYNPDVGQGAPYEYRYRYRCSSTGARSNWSPPGRTPVNPHRYQTLVTCTVCGVTECDKVDVQRRGGSINVWVTIATIDNGGLARFNDSYSDQYALDVSVVPESLEGNVNAQPFVDTDAAFTATAAKIAGPMVNFGSAVANLGWAEGTQVIANGITTSIYRVLTTSLIELYDHVGQGTNLKVEIPEPFIVGRAFPVVFGPVDGWYYALGSTLNPGRMYIFNRYTMDSTRSAYWVDLAAADEPLQNGCVYNDRGYVWSDKRMFTFIPNPLAQDYVDKAEVVGSPGMRFRWMLAVGDLMYWGASDGIYSSDGQTTRCITRRDLQRIFPNESTPGIDFNGIPAPDFAAAASSHRLAYADNKVLYYDYVSQTGAAKTTLLLDRAGGDRTPAGEAEWGWWLDTYAYGAVCHYNDVRPGAQRVLIGGSTAPTAKFYVYDFAATADDGASFDCAYQSFANDEGFSGSRNKVGHGILDVDPGGVAIASRYLFDNFATNAAGNAIGPAAGRTGPVMTLLDVYARNVAIQATWTITAANQTPILYVWSYAYLKYPDDVRGRPSDYSDMGYWGPKELRGLDLECDTSALLDTIFIEYTTEAGGTAVVQGNVTSSTKSIAAIAIVPPVICYEARVKQAGTTNLLKMWQVTKWHYDPLVDMNNMVGEWTKFKELRWVQGVELEGDTNNVPVNVPLQTDFNVVAYTIPAVTHPGRGTKSYAFDPPFLAYMVRTAPSAAIRVLSTKYVSQPEAAIGILWQTQEMELGNEHVVYGHPTMLEVEYASASQVTLEWWLDGAQIYVDAALLVATGADPTFRRRRVRLPSTKGRLGYVKLRAAYPGLRVRFKGTRICVVSESYGEVWRPLAGADHRDEETGARL